MFIMVWRLILSIPMGHTIFSLLKHLIEVWQVITNFNFHWTITLLLLFLTIIFRRFALEAQSLGTHILTLILKN